MELNKWSRTTVVVAALLGMAGCDSVRQLQRQLDDVRAQLQKTMEAVEGAANKLDELQGRLTTALDTASEGAENTRQDLESQLAELKTEVRSLNTRLEQLREKEKRLKELFDRPR